jgi:FtsP/CotA-like multicopper oxidase with cupredoxin domain
MRVPMMNKRFVDPLSFGLSGSSAVSRRQMIKVAGMAAAFTALPFGVRGLMQEERADYSLEIGPYSLEVAANRFVKTIAYNGQVPGPLLRMREGRPVTIAISNKSSNEEIVHWHGMFLPSDVDGAMEEGTPMIPPGGTTRQTFTPSPSGFRWYHTHTFAGTNLRKSQYTGQHGFLFVEPRENRGDYDQEAFVALHDWNGYMHSSDDGSMNPVYDISTINGRTLGFGEPLRVKAGQRLLLHVLNSSPTEPHWIALAGHTFEVIALDGNAVPKPQRVSMLRLSPAERVSAVVELNNPGVWVLGEVRKHIQAAGMGLVVEYAGQSGKAQWVQANELVWDYNVFSGAASTMADANVIEIPLIFQSKFAGHGAPDHWTINGKSYPKTDSIALNQGQRYRLVFKNLSTDDHPVHLHRHSFELRRLAANVESHGILKDVVLVGANSQVEVEFTASNPGKTLFHCHQQNHMDEGFMMLFHYA